MQSFGAPGSAPPPPRWPLSFAWPWRRPSAQRTPSGCEPPRETAGGRDLRRLEVDKVAMCVYIYIQTYIYIYIYICTCTHAYAYAFTYVYVYAYL